LQESKRIMENFTASVQTLSLRRKLFRPVRHPGVILEAEWLKPLGVSVHEFAAIWDIDPQILHDIIKGKKPVDAAISSKLQDAFNIPATYWLQSQIEYNDSIHI
jgi:addiction module HigA family antidote